jgi:hypothetical protein
VEQCHENSRTGATKGVPQSNCATERIYVCTFKSENLIIAQVSRGNLDLRQNSYIPAHWP